MIKSVTIINPFGDDPLVLNLPTSHEEHGIYIQKIEGIGPEKATINTTSLAMEDGGIFNSAKADIRNIVITLGFYESSILHNSIEDSRHLTYKYFPKKKEIKLIFDTDNRTSWINGYVESNTPDIFNKEESCQISIICPDPNFYDVDEQDYTFSSESGSFEFPFENDITDDSKLDIIGGMDPEGYHVVNALPIMGEANKYYYVKKVVNDKVYYDEFYYLENGPFVPLQENKVINNAHINMGKVSESEVYELYYNGDVDTGIKMTIHFLGDTGDILINNTITDDIIELDSDRIKSMVGIGEFQLGDDIEIISKVSKKSIKFKRENNDPINILNSMNKNYFDRSWFILTKGINKFTYDTTFGRDNIQIIIEVDNAYDGI